MTTHYRILPGLPPYGPMALPFPSNGRRAFSEGLVVEFESQHNGTWTGNFQRGNGRLDKAFQHIDEKHVIVIAGSKGYMVDPEAPTNTTQISGQITFVETLPQLEAVLFGDDLQFEAWRAQGMWWRSPRISWDGMRNIQIEGSELNGEAFSPLNDEWSPFGLDLLTGACKGSIYEAQMANAIPIGPHVMKNPIPKKRSETE